MTNITVTQTFGSVEALVNWLNTLPEYNRADTLEVRTYDGWRPIHFKWINGTFERVVLTDENLFN